MKDGDIRKAVRDGYAKVAKQSGSCCASGSPCCAGADSATMISKSVGYSEEELSSVPEGANLGLGCGNPTALASLQKGETVLDLGSGAGFDCFLAADRVGKQGKVIGVDMTPEMVEKARENARKGSYKNVEFRLGEIEYMPVADSSVDVIISNCVINLSLDKKKVFKEAFRALKSGGRLMISDIVLLKELPASVRESIEAYVGCIAGATMKDEYLRTIKAAGFRNVNIVEETSFPVEYMANDPTAQAIIKDSGISPEKMKEFASSVLSIKVSGVKP
ncbi:MAG: arsenite S-adenosylmethyltransferase [Chloroflexi bacterium RBG_13_52_14]|nr:MAG: arsenite S-adenosylmethyltransferase [Chloroflexi bacterium RBG_13_52_14]